ncbi:DUF6653 family protein [Flexibacterium corallicola]|uniref:DUF6653 family protein n=1 Tax=Flexibacterium corallicola TaxID=3037259 RepID=UPI00286F48DB|nr:DUF6653 family protein [Pseudovibrio sp. M1P-2-3]
MKDTSAVQNKYKAGTFRARALPVGQLRTIGLDSRLLTAQATWLSLNLRLISGPLTIATLYFQPDLGWPITGSILLFIAAIVIFAPRLLSLPVNVKSWPARAAFGERIWHNRHFVPIESLRSKQAFTLTLVTLVGMVSGIVGAINTLPLIAITGGSIALLSKLTYLDSMSRLYAEVKNTHPVYKSWQLSPDNDNNTYKVYPPLNRRG